MYEGILKTNNALGPSYRFRLLNNKVASVEQLFVHLTIIAFFYPTSLVLFALTIEVPNTSISMTNFRTYQF